MAKQLCLHCGMEQEFSIQVKKDRFEVKDQTVDVEIKISICSVCNQEIWNETLERENDRIIFNAYRKKVNLLLPEEIKAIREKYGMTQSGFSLLLGFGAKTVTRYENGSIQDQAHDIIMRLMASHVAFAEVWNLRKSVVSKAEFKLVEHRIKLCQQSVPYDYEPSCFKSDIAFQYPFQPHAEVPNYAD